MFGVFFAGTETAPTGDGATAAAVAKFDGHRDSSVSRYESVVPGSRLKQCMDDADKQFCKKNWAKKLELRRKLHSLRRSFSPGSHETYDGSVRSISRLTRR